MRIGVLTGGGDVLGSTRTNPYAREDGPQVARETGYETPPKRSRGCGLCLSRNTSATECYSGNSGEAFSPTRYVYADHSAADRWCTRMTYDRDLGGTHFAALSVRQGGLP